jgi:hypothetical protein
MKAEEKRRRSLAQVQAAPTTPGWQLAPDYLHKANISGGMAYGFTVPNTPLSMPSSSTKRTHFRSSSTFAFAFGGAGFLGLKGEALGDDGRRTLVDLLRDLEPF